MVNTVASYFGTAPTFISTVYLAACCRADVQSLLCQMFLHPGWLADKHVGRTLFRAARRRCSPWWASACGDGLDRHAAHVQKLTSAFLQSWRRAHGGLLFLSLIPFSCSSPECRRKMHRRDKDTKEINYRPVFPPQTNVALSQDVMYCYWSTSPFKGSGIGNNSPVSGCGVCVNKQVQWIPIFLD